MTSTVIASALAAAKMRSASDVLDAVDTAVRGDRKGIQTRPLSLFLTDEVSIFLVSPYADYRLVLADKLRRMEPPDGIPLGSGYRIVVYPRRIGSPDFDTIVLQRDDTIVKPLEVHLKPETMTTRLGAKFTVHAGSIVYPCSAFAPGADLTITAIPKVGDNWVKKLSPEDLENIR